MLGIELSEYGSYTPHSDQRRELVGPLGNGTQHIPISSL